MHGDALLAHAPEDLVPILAENVFMTTQGLPIVDRAALQVGDEFEGDAIARWEAKSSFMRMTLFCDVPA
jgi:hypothetical protein